MWKSRPFGVLLVSILLPAWLLVISTTPAQQDDKPRPADTLPEKPDPYLGGTGTAFVVHPDGYLITNAHVIRGAGKDLVIEDALIEVVVNERNYSAEVVVIDEQQDLALLKVKGHDMPSLPLVKAEGVQLGEEIRIIGYPLGYALGSSAKVTRGTVSGFQASEKRGKVILTDTAINPGNSGGPAVNAAGEVIGVATAKVIEANVNNIGICVAIDRTKSLFEQAGIEPKATVPSGRVEGVDLIKRILPALALVRNTPLRTKMMVPDHTKISQVVFSPDGTGFATRSYDKSYESKVCLWELSSSLMPTLLQTIRIKDDGDAFAYLPDGKRVALGSDDRLIIWDLEKRAPALVLDHVDRTSDDDDIRYGVEKVAVSALGTYLASVSMESVQVWDLKREQRLYSFPIKRTKTLEFSPGERWLIVLQDCNYDDRNYKNLRIWDMQSGELVREFPVPNLRSASFAMQRDHLIIEKESFFTEPPIKYGAGIWSLEGQEIFDFKWESNHTFTPRRESEKYLAAHGDWGGIEILDPSNGKTVFKSAQHGGFPRLTTFPGNAVREITISKDGAVVVTGHDDGAVRCWRWQDKIKQVPTVLAIDYPEQIGEQFAISPASGEVVAFRNAWGGEPSKRLPAELIVIDAKTGTVAKKLPAREQTMAITFSPDGRYLASTGREKNDEGQEQVSLWDAKTWTFAKSWALESNGARSLVFSPDNRRLATLESSKEDKPGVEYEINLWDVESGKRLKNISPAGSKVGVGLAYAPDGLKLAVGDFEGGITLWDLETANSLGTIQGEGTIAEVLSFSADSKLLAGGCRVDNKSGTLHVWDVATQKEVRALPLGDKNGINIDAAIFSPDGKWLLASGQDRLNIWSTKTWKLVKTYDSIYCRTIGFLDQGKQAVWMSTGKTLYRMELD